MTADELEHLVLCDAICLLLLNDGTLVHVTDRRLDAAVKRYAADAPGQDPQSLRGRVSTLDRNRDGGYWAAGAGPDEAQHALVGRHRLTDVAGVVLTSDGATRGFERLGIHRVEEFTPQALAGDHLGVLEAVREAEMRQEAGLHSRGEKIHDDFTIVSLCLPTEGRPGRR